MSITVKTYSSSRNVWVAYALQICSVHAYSLYEENPDGTLSKLDPIEYSITKSKFSQGKEDIIGNNSVSHQHLNGDITFLPKSSTKSFTRSVSTSPPSQGYTDYYKEYIETSASKGEGSTHYTYKRLNHWPDRPAHYTFDRQWSMRSVVESEVRFADDFKGAGSSKYYYRVDFPELTTKDIVWMSSYGSYRTNVPAQSLMFTESGALYRSRNTSIGLIKFGLLDVPDISKISSLLDIPACSGPVEPDDLLVRLTKKIGSLRVNNLANIAQLRKLDELLPPTLKKGSKLFKTAADFLLWYKYSYKTTDMDIEEMMKYYFRVDEPIVNCKAKGFAHRATVSCKPADGVSDTFTFYLGSYQQSIIQKFGLQLNLGNTWDMIPFSFVVDWFTKIGDMLESLDAIDEWTQVPLICYVSSRKAITPYSLPANIKAVGRLTLNNYIRNVSRTLPMTVVSPSLNIPRGHLPEALSLLIASKR